MSLTLKTFGLASALIALVWIVDAAVGAAFFYEGTFLDLLFLDVPGIEVYWRAMVAVPILLLTVILSNLLTRVQAGQEALRESEGKYRQLFSGQMDAIFIFDAKTRRILDVNPAAEVLYGYGREEFLQLSVLDISGEQQKTDAIINSFANRDISRIPLRYHRKKDGTLFPVEISPGFFIWNERDVLCGIVRDITKRMQAEEERERARAFLQTVIDGLPESLLVIDRDYSIAMANKTVLEASGGEDPVAAGLKCHQVSHGSATPCPGGEHPCPWDLVVEASAPVTVEHIHRDVEGQPMTVEITASPVFDEKGDVVQIIESCRDITERKQAERELLDSRNRLRDLTVRLDEVREEERALLARELHDEVGQSLTAMRMDLAMVEKEIPAGLEGVADRLHSMLDLTQDSVDRVNRMSHDLRSPVLDLLGLEAAVESEALEHQERWGTETGLELEVGELEALPERDLTVHRVLQEALSNARRHAEAGRVEVSLRTVGKELVLEVLDDGIGITDEQSKDPGSFGLIGMRERIERLGGTVVIERRPEGGTRIRASVPITP